MFADVKEWFGIKHRFSPKAEQYHVRNEAWEFEKKNGIIEEQVSFNHYAVKWVDGETYVISRKYKKNGELGKRLCVETAQEYLDSLYYPVEQNMADILIKFMEDN